MHTKNLSSLFLTCFIFLAFTSTGFAQKAGKEMKKLVKSFEKAYNEKDQATITSMFTDNAVRIDANGVTTTGAAKIGEIYAQSFTNTDTKAAITHLDVKEVDGSNAITTGSFTVNGVTKTGEKVAIAGTYENTVVKENGKWKISQMKLMNAK
jgi:ketosteroid isomerase-like protein